MCTSTPPSEAPDPSPSPSASPSHWACQYTAWYPQFQRHALRSRVVTLPLAFVEYLLSDGVYLGDESKAVRAKLGIQGCYTANSRCITVQQAAE